MNSYLRKRVRAFKVAGIGVYRLFRLEAHAKIHLVAAILALSLAAILHCSASEWCIIIICIGCVLASEAINTAVEKVSDRITTEYDPLIGAAKDLAAAAVLLMATAALTVGIIIFAPKIL